MNVRRIVMVMLVLGFLVQGGAATTYITSMNAQPPSGSKCDEFNYEYDYSLTTTGMAEGITKYVSWDGYTINSGGTQWKRGGNTVFTPSESGSITTTDSFEWIRAYGNCPGNPWAFPGDSYIILSSEPSSIASGSSCISGTFFIYVDNSYGLDLLNTSADSYSFNIYNNLNYSIYFDTLNEWHNFTASGSDEEWNPTCTLPSISGTIIALDGEGIYNLNVTLHDFYIYERDLVDSTFTDSNGSYIIYVNDSDDAGPYALSVSGYCNNGANCSAFRIEAPINPGGESYVFDYTWQIPSNIRVDLQYENGTAVSGALLNIKNLPDSVGAWKTTASDGYTTYTSLQTSKVYVDYHGGDNSSGGSAGSDVLHSFQLVPNGQYRWSQFALSIPDDYVNNTTIPPILPPVDEVNKTDISNMTTDSMFLVSVNDVLGSPIPQVTVTASAADKNYTGKFSGFTNTSGQWSFPKNSTVGQYDVSVGITCFLPQTKTRFSSADFTLEYSCDAELPGQDENGTGGWKSNDSYSNWTMNGTAADESTTKTKLSSWLYFFGVGIFFIMFATYFVKK